jgi:hypothetical protein
MPPVPVAGIMGMHIVVSKVHVTGSHSNMPEPAPIDAQVASPRFVGSQGMVPVPHAAFGAATAVFVADAVEPAPPV